MRKLKVLDLFSGLGGFSLGLERTGGFETVAFCDIEPHARAIIKKHWPHVPVYEDVSTLNPEGEIDVITGGFPCQDLSSAGQKKGIIDGERSGLWGHMFRLTRDIRPKYMLAENVTGLVTGDDGRWFSKLLSDLASIRFDVEWHRVSASDLGGGHERQRVWIIAYPSEVGRKRAIIKTIPPQRGDMGGQFLTHSDIPRLVSWVKGEAKSFGGLRGEPMRHRDDDGVSDWMDRVARCGNSLIPYIPEYIGHAILASQPETAGEGTS